MKKVSEVIERMLCFTECSQGQFLDFENGCVSTCPAPDKCEYHCTGFKENAKIFLRALSEAGYVVVPRKATDAMERAGEDTFVYQELPGTSILIDADAERVWDAMLSAAEKE